MLQNEFVLAKLGLDTALTGPLKVWGLSTYATRNSTLCTGTANLEELGLRGGEDSDRDREDRHRVRGKPKSVP